MSELGPEARQLVDLARDADLPGEDERRRVRGALFAKIAAGAVVGASATAASSSAAASGAGVAAAGSGGALLAVKVAAAVVLLGGGVAVPLVALRETEPAAPAHTAAHRAAARGRGPAAAERASSVGQARRQAPAAVEGAAPPAAAPLGASALRQAPGATSPPATRPASATPSALRAPLDGAGATGRDPARSVEVSRSRSSRVTSGRTVAQPRGRAATTQERTTQTLERAAGPSREGTPPQPSGDLAGEAAMLRGALAAIRDGRPQEAVAELDRHAAGHPEGVLLQERIATRIRALCALGRGDEAARESATFLRRWPTSPLAPRVRAGCRR